MIDFAGWHVVFELYAANFNKSVALCRADTCGLGIEYYLTHFSPLPCFLLPAD